jgi:hypothetical protein
MNIANEQREIIDKHYSVTTILSPTRMILLNRRYNDEIEQDVSDMIWMIWGTAVHYILEKADNENMTEFRFTQHIKDGYYLTGQIDLYNNDTYTIEDYKTASVWKILYKDFSDWEKQGLMYAWLLISNGIHVEEIKFHALLKDWSSSKAKYDSNYPEHPIYTHTIPVTVQALNEIREYIFNRFDEIIANESSEELPPCTEAERWATPTKYAHMKKGRKSAIKLYDEYPNITLAEDEYIDIREGEDKRCMEYCNVCKKCDYWLSRYGKE